MESPPAQDEINRLSDSVGQWADRLAECHLPLLVSTARALSNLNPDSGIPMDRVCERVPGDPGAALEIVRRANAGRARNLGSRIATLDNAAMMLGMSQLRALPSALDRLDPLEADTAQRRYLQLASRSYHAGLQAYRWAHRRGDMMPKEVFLAAMLHDVGELLMSLHGGAGELERIRVLQCAERMPADEAQYVVLGFSLEQLTRTLAARWNLPELLLQSLEAEHASQPRVLGVMYASQLARLAEGGWYGDELQECLANVSAWLDVPEGHIASEVHVTAVEAARDVQHFRVFPAARRLPMLPGEEPEEAAESDSADDGEPTPVHFCLMPQLAVYEEVTDRLMNYVPAGSNLHELMTEVMRGLHDGLGLNRVVFAMLNRDRSLLQARYLAGTDNDPGFSRFALRLDHAHLFSRMLEREQAVWVNQDNHARFWPLVPEPVRRLVHTDTFFAASVVVDTKPIGLFYADRHLPDSRLDANAYQRFKKLCQLSTAAIGRLRRA